MISFVKKADPKPLPNEAGDNRFEQIRKAAAEGRKKSDSAGARRARQAAGNDQPI